MELGFKLLDPHIFVMEFGLQLGDFLIQSLYVILEVSVFFLEELEALFAAAGGIKVLDVVHAVLLFFHEFG